MTGDLKRCEKCMRALGATNICPACGHINGKNSTFLSYLPPKTVLNDRYVLGMLLRSNGESGVYIAYDTEIDLVVEIKEFMPGTVARRLPDGSLQVDDGSRQVFEEMRSEFILLNNTLSKIRTLANIIQIYSTFEQNNTVYAVMEHIEGENLREYLADHFGELSWDDAAALFLPTMKTLGELHKIGIFHYGLSPETIYVTAKNQMKISGFSIPELHNRQSVINTELFKGYAAPEQYETPMDSCGAWTDVYSLAATIYKTLTGTMPPDSKTRTGNDNLLPPDSLNASVPKSVSIALMSALTISPKLRTQTMSELKGDITSAPRGAKPSQFQLDIPEEKRELREEQEEKSSKKYILIAMGVTGAILIVVSIFILLYLFGGQGDDTPASSSSSSSLFSSSSSGSSSASAPSSSKPTGSTSMQTEYRMFNLLGKDVDIVTSDPVYTDVVKITIGDQIYSDEYAKGEICTQDVDPDKPIEKGQVVTVQVSKGSRYPTVPSFAGKSVAQYTNELEALGITNWKVRTVTDPDKEPDTIVDTQVAPGQKVDLENLTVFEIWVVSR